MIKGVTELYHLNETNPDKALDLAGREFESIFTHQLLKAMGESMPEGLFGDGLASDIYQDMLFQAMARAMADSGALGIGDAVSQHVKAVSMPGGRDE
jgi:Rod binding domain-containing protein